MTQEVLKLALEALENGDVPTPENAGKNLDAITAIKEALAKEKTLQALHSENERLGFYKDAYAQPEQEPVAWMHQNRFTGKATIVWDLGLATPNQNWKPLYTTPPQRTWVGLTDEEFNDLRDNNFGVSPLISAVEAKLKERNG